MPKRRRRSARKIHDSIHLKWRDNMEIYINDESNHDVTFVVGFDDNIKEIGCIKHFLAAQSKVFKQMLFGPFANNNSIIINDIKPEIFKIMYDGLCGLSLRINVDNVVDLCCISDKYLLNNLQDACLEFIKNDSVCYDEPIKVLEIVNSLMNKKLEKIAQKALEHFVQSKGIYTQSCHIYKKQENN